MNVLDFNPILSDVHKPIDVSIKCSSKTFTAKEETTTHYGISRGERVGAWDSSQAGDFVLNLNRDNIQAYPMYSKHVF